MAAGERAAGRVDGGVRVTAGRAGDGRALTLATGLDLWGCNTTEMRMNGGHRRVLQGRIEYDVDEDVCVTGVHRTPFMNALISIVRNF